MNRYFLCGLLAGIAAGALTAPATGLKTRKMLAANAKKRVDEVLDAAKRTKEAVEQTAEGIANAFAQGRKKLAG